MIVDCFIFNDELDLLEIRLNSLAPYVDRFVLCESPMTHSGKPKKLYFDENKDRFKDFPITHLIVDDYEKYVDKDSWIREHHDREFMTKGILDCDSKATILISDLDEIPDLTNFKEGMEGVFMQDLYYYYFNTCSGEKWNGTVAARRRNIDSLDIVRKCRMILTPMYKCWGWHFSTLLPVENIVNKLDSFAHQELNTDEIKSKLEENIKNLDDPYNRKDKGKLFVKMPSGPKWLLDNRDKYKHLFYEAA